MPPPLSLAEAVLLLRKAEKESLPVELVGKGQAEQALVVIGLYRWIRNTEESAESLLAHFKKFITPMHDGLLVTEVLRGFWAGWKLKNNIEFPD